MSVTLAMILYVVGALALIGFVFFRKYLRTPQTFEGWDGYGDNGSMASVTYTPIEVFGVIVMDEEIIPAVGKERMEQMFGCAADYIAKFRNN